ncbi:hypothetical protein ES703_66057 [subsurface metagenome]
MLVLILCFYVKDKTYDYQIEKNINITDRIINKILKNCMIKHKNI